MSTVADIRKRIDALMSAVTPPRELMLLARMELLSDDQRAELARHNDAVERFHANARAVGLSPADLYKAMCDHDGHWWKIRPVLRRDVRELLYGPPPPPILVTDTVEQAARKYYEFAGIGITPSSHRRGRR